MAGSTLGTLSDSELAARFVAESANEPAAERAIVADLLKFYVGLFGRAVGRCAWRVSLEDLMSGSAMWSNPVPIHERALRRLGGRE